MRNERRFEVGDMKVTKYGWYYLEVPIERIEEGDHIAWSSIDPYDVFVVGVVVKNYSGSLTVACDYMHAYSRPPIHYTVPKNRVLGIHFVRKTPPKKITEDTFVLWCDSTNPTSTIGVVKCHSEDGIILIRDKDDVVWSCTEKQIESILVKGIVVSVMKEEKDVKDEVWDDGEEEMECDSDDRNIDTEVCTEKEIMMNSTQENIDHLIAASEKNADSLIKKGTLDSVKKHLQQKYMVLCDATTVLEMAKHKMREEIEQCQDILAQNGMTTGGACSSVSDMISDLICKTESKGTKITCSVAAKEAFEETFGKINMDLVDWVEEEV